uniref:Uncharacterized protein n=1 Tax=Cacopsylla melanoneura TaxID=428564 RepID=A0A8D8RJ79_9HEMI
MNSSQFRVVGVKMIVCGRVSIVYTGLRRTSFQFLFNSLSSSLDLKLHHLMLFSHDIQRKSRLMLFASSFARGGGIRHHSDNNTSKRTRYIRTCCVFYENLYRYIL